MVDQKNKCPLEIPPWTTVSVSVLSRNFPRLVIGSEHCSSMVVHSQLLSPQEREIWVTNPHSWSVTLTPETEIAKAINLPWLDKDHRPQGPRSFLYWTQQILSERSTITLMVDGRPLEGMVDTGADVSVIKDSDWDSQWLTQGASQTVAGVGGTQLARKSERFLAWQYEDTQGKFKPLCVPGLPVNLWGRDVLSAMGAHLCTESHLN